MSGHTGVTTVRDRGVSLEQSTSVDGDDLVVTLDFYSEQDAPVVVRFEVDVPDGGCPVGIGDRREPGLRGGIVEGTVLLVSGRTETVSYRVSVEGGTEPDTVPEPRIVSTLGIDPDAALPSELAEVRWNPTGARSVPLPTTGTQGAPAPPTPADSGEGVTAHDALDGSERIPDADLPAIGIIARAEDSDGVYRTVLEARKRGFDVLLTAFGEGTEELMEIVSEVGVELVEPPRPGADWQTLRSTLAARAREAGYPGIVFQPEGCPRIDYEGTMAAYEVDGYEMYAVPERPDASQGHPDVIVGIPAYNAAGTIGSVVTEAKQFADEVVVVDDGSSDATAQHARDAGATVVVHSRNRGYGGALKTIFRTAHDRGAAHLVTIDADGQHDPGDIPRLVATQDDSDAGVVIASRYGTDTEMPFVRSLGLAVVNTLTNFSMGRFRRSRHIGDTQSGFRAYTAEALATLVAADDIGDGMGASTDILYATNDAGFDFHEIGTTIRYDVAHGSTESAAEHGFGLVYNIAGFFQRTHPIALVGIPGLVLILGGSMALGWSIVASSPSGIAIPVLVGSILSVSVGIALLVLSVVLHVLNTHPFFKRR